MFGNLFRSSWRLREPPPNINKDRIMCSSCKFHTEAMAGRYYDRCHHPKADLGSIIRNDESPQCIDMRSSSAQCGQSAKWFEPSP